MGVIDAKGPAFLVFYLFFGVTLYFLARIFVYFYEVFFTQPVVTTWKDPYRVAILRDGKIEAMRTLIISLVNQGKIKIEGDEGKQRTIVPVQGVDPAASENRYERELLQRIKSPVKYADLSSLTKGGDFFTQEEEALKNQGYLHKGLNVQRIMIIFFATLVLGLGGAKIIYAIIHGHFNILILCLFIGVYGLIFWLLYRKKQTRAGRRAIKSLRSLYKKSRKNNGDASMLFAIFGAVAVAEILDPGLFRFMGIAPNGNSTSSGSDSMSCSSSCSSSCGSSCGGGCGGCGGD